MEGVTEWNDSKIIYRHYATLYFILVVDGSESELGILDLIQVVWISSEPYSPMVTPLAHIPETKRRHLSISISFLAKVNIEPNCFAFRQRGQRIAWPLHCFAAFGRRQEGLVGKACCTTQPLPQVIAWIIHFLQFLWGYSTNYNPIFGHIILLFGSFT